MAITNLMPWKWNEKSVPVKQDESPSFYSLQHGMNHLFDDFHRHFDLTTFDPFSEFSNGFSPNVNVTENDKNIIVSAELPGLDENEIEVSLNHNMLTISGEKKEDKEEKGDNYYRLERAYGSFQRTIPLPVEIEADKIEAKFKKGVLTVNLPKTAEAQKQAKRIAVKTG